VLTAQRDLAFGGFPRSLFPGGVYVGDLLQTDPFGIVWWLRDIAQLAVSYTSQRLGDLLTMASEDVTLAFDGEGLVVLLAILKARI
jgi:hypothetical protein